MLHGSYWDPAKCVIRDHIYWILADLLFIGKIVLCVKHNQVYCCYLLSKEFEHYSLLHENYLKNDVFWLEVKWWVWDPDSDLWWSQVGSYMNFANLFIDLLSIDSVWNVIFVKGRWLPITWLWWENFCHYFSGKEK